MNSIYEEVSINPEYMATSIKKFMSGVYRVYRKFLEIYEDSGEKYSPKEREAVRTIVNDNLLDYRNPVSSSRMIADLNRFTTSKYAQMDEGSLSSFLKKSVLTLGAVGAILDFIKAIMASTNFVKMIYTQNVETKRVARSDRNLSWVYDNVIVPGLRDIFDDVLSKRVRSEVSAKDKIFQHYGSGRGQLPGAIPPPKSMESVMSTVRNYIFEYVDPEVAIKVKKYLRAMEAYLITLYRDTADKDLTTEQKKGLEKGVTNALFAKKDYSKEKHASRILKDVHIPFNEAFGDLSSSDLDMVPSDNPDFYKKTSDKIRDFFSKEGRENLKSKLSKDSLFPSGEEKRGVRIRNGIIIASLVSVLSGFIFVTVRRKLSRDRDFKRIVAKDINPLVLEIAKGIIRGRISGEGSINRYILDIWNGVEAKHFL